MIMGNDMMEGMVILPIQKLSYSKHKEAALLCASVFKLVTKLLMSNFTKIFNLKR